MPVGVRVGVGVGVEVAVAVEVALAVDVAVAVEVAGAVEVAVEVGDAEGVGVRVGTVWRSGFWSGVAQATWAMELRAIRPDTSTARSTMPGSSRGDLITFTSLSRRLPRPPTCPSGRDWMRACQLLVAPERGSRATACV